MAEAEDNAEEVAAALPQPKRRGLASAMIRVAKTRWQRAKNAIIGLARWARGGGGDAPVLVVAKGAPSDCATSAGKLYAVPVGACGTRTCSRCSTGTAARR